MLSSVANIKSRKPTTLILMLLFLFLTACDSKDHRSDDPDMRCWDRQEAFVYAAYYGDLAKMKALFAEGVDINASTGAEGHETHPSLILAAGEGHLDVVKFLLDNGADVNVRGRDGYTSLMSAAWSGHKEIVKLLIGKGADVNAITSERGSVLAIASAKPHPEVIEILKQAGAKK